MIHRTQAQIVFGSIALLLATACGGGFDESMEATGSADEALARAPAPADDPIVIKPTKPTKPAPTTPPINDRPPVELPTTAAPTTPLVGEQPPSSALAMMPGGASSLVGQGAGWRHFRVSGTFHDTEANVDKTISNQDVVVVRGVDGLSTAPISALTKSALTADSTAALAAGGEGLESDMVYIIDLATAAQLGTPSNIGVAARSSGCNDYYKSFPATKSFTKPGSSNESFTSGGFVGSLKVDANASGEATASLRFKVKRGSVLGYCVPYAVGFVKATMSGTASATADIELSGNFRQRWAYRKQIAKPEIGTYPFFIGPVPVVIGLNVPIEAGVQASAFVTAQAKGQARADASFEFSCTIHGCDGSKTASAGFTPHGEPVAFVSGRATMRPWVQAALRVFLYSDDVAYAQVGVQPGIDFDAFGYAGDACGDGNGDGTNEYVAGSSLDSQLGINLTAKASAFGSDTDELSWSVATLHLGFWKSGPGIAPWSPMLRSAGSGAYTGSVVAAMRPCWPYPDAVNANVAWPDGSTSPGSVTPGGSTFSHTFPAKGTYRVSVTVGSDAKGRDLGGEASTMVYVAATPRDHELTNAGVLAKSP